METYWQLNVSRNGVSGVLKSSDVLEDLRPLMTDNGVNNRLSGVQFLSAVLGRLPVDHLPPEDISLLINFYVDRLKNDHHSLNPATISGLCSLITMAKIQDQDVGLGLRSLINGETMTVQTQVKTRTVTHFRCHSQAHQLQTGIP